MQELQNRVLRFHRIFGQEGGQVGISSDTYRKTFIPARYGEDLSANELVTSSFSPSAAR